MLDSSVQVGAVGTENKQMPVTYDASKVTVHQLVQRVSETPGVHGKPYEAGVLVAVEDLAKNAAKVKKALGQVKGVVNVANAPGATPESGEVFVMLRPLARNAKLADQVKASQIAEALEKGGIKFSGLPTGSAAGGANDAETKKKPAGTKGTAKTKPGEGDSAAEKSKPARPAASTTKTKPARDPSAKSKDDDPGEKPRFQILAGDEDKVYLVDHETKTEEGKELKKLVKAGDKFGDFIVKEVGDDDGLYVVLEHSETKDSTRVEHKKKDKESDKPKEDKPKDAKRKQAGDKESKEEKKDKDAN